MSEPKPIAKISAGGVKKGKNQGEKIVTANRLTDGIVVYRAPDGAWTEDIAMAAVVEGDAAMDFLVAANADEAFVVGPYLMDITQEGGAIEPDGRGRLREVIRDLGPTIHPDFGRQAQRD